jgi:exopolysaccharide biosynthesis protein
MTIFLSFIKGANSILKTRSRGGAGKMGKKKMDKKKKKKIIIISTSVALVVSIILFLLAYRYLIEREEKTVVDNQVVSSVEYSEVTYDDWNYSREDLQISIKKVTEGSGKNIITYYVADVQVTNGNLIQAAFAKNKFGRNITENTSTIAENNDAIFAINGDYYGFRDDGVIIRNGTVYRECATRVGMGFTSDGYMKIFNEKSVSANDLLSSGITNTYSFGPALVQDGVAATDFNDVMVDTNFGNRTIDEANPRTGVGMIDQNHFVFIVVDGRSSGYSTGMTLTQFAQTFKDLGCTEAYNLDGGGSSTMYFMGRVVNNPLGKGTERGVSDIICIK